MNFSNYGYPRLYSNQIIQKEENIMFIPKSHLISLSMAKAAPIGEKIILSGLDLFSPKHSLLSSFILQEKRNPLSFWKPYLDILPVNLNNFPIFYTQTELKWLAGSPFLLKIEEKKSNLLKDYNAICAAVPEFSRFSLQAYSKIMMYVSSRIFGCEINGQKEDVFVPLIDMLNHKSPRESSWGYDDDRQGFFSDSLMKIDKGKELTYSCGSKCNTRFLLNYGIIVPNNKENEYPLSIKFDENDCFLSMKYQLIQGIGEDLNKAYRVTTDIDNPEFRKLLNVLRLNAIDNNNEVQILSIQLNQNIPASIDHLLPICISNEIKALTSLKSYCTTALSKYPNTLEDDIQLLNTNLNLNQRNCVMMRQGEKIILHYWIRFANIIIQLFDKSIEEIFGNQSLLEFQTYVAMDLLTLKALEE